MTRLRLEDLRKSYGDTVVIDGISLDVAAGECITLLGPSGCGKTTMLKIIAGFVRPDGGRVFFDDDEMSLVAPNKRWASMCFQSYALFPHMSVYNNVAFGLKMQKIRGEEQRHRVLEVLSIVGMEPYANRRPSELSGGQQQRVALARSVVTRPRILLFDEPLSNLDAKLREEVRVEIRRLQQDLGITSIYVTHDQAEALVISDRIVVIRQGRIEQIGEPHEIYRNPRTGFVADFIGSVNLSRGRIVELGEGVCVLELGYGRFTVSRERDFGGERAVGDVLSLLWRPEDANICASDADNSFEARVEEVIFMGNLTELHLASGNERLRVLMSGRTNLERGGMVRLRLDGSAFSILDEA